jgi:parvulin-like peptidyl-prolyl isomerase
MEKKINMFAITTVLLAIIIVAMGLSLVSRTSPFEKVLKTYQQNYPESLLSIQRLIGDNAKAASQQLNSYCPGFNLEEFYLVQFDNAATRKSVIMAINPITGRTECTIDRSAPANATQKQTLNQNLLATINGEPVYMEEVAAIYNNIPAESRTNASLQEALDQVIGNKLLVQDAVKKAISVKEEEIDTALNTFLTNNGLTLQQLEERLTTAGSSVTIFRNNLKNSLLLQKEVSEVTKNAPLPTEADLQAYYDANKQGFVTIAKATTKQLLLYSNQSNDAEKLAQIKGIATMINATNFCELVNTYSQDAASISRCGLYDFQQGQLLPEYEQVVFSSQPGTAKIIKTSIGYHIVEIINVSLPQQLSYDQVKENIKNYLLLINKQLVLSQYVQQLRQQADVVSYINQ